MNETNLRIKDIDLLKGLLIILVILGHIIQGKLSESIWRNLIYSFHMPLFIGITGYLFNIVTISRLSLIGIFNKYFFRLILPWSIAAATYYIVRGILGTNSFSLLTLKNSLLYPFYHLWFIPGFLSWIVLTWILKKIFANFNHILFLGFFISLIFMILHQYPKIYSDIHYVTRMLSIITYTFRPYFYIFFLIGIYYRSIPLHRPNIFEILSPLFFLCFVIYLFYNENIKLSILNFFVLNFFILNLCLKLASTNSLFQFNFIEWLGKNSLGIYLWHVLPILISKYLLGLESLGKFYLVTFIFEIAFMIIYIGLIKIPFFKKYVFGM